MRINLLTAIKLSKLGNSSFADFICDFKISTWNCSWA